ncbi:MAG: hypothetical protein EOP34_03025, partial [Rickettsiales bacterium]
MTENYKEIYKWFNFVINYTSSIHIAKTKEYNDIFILKCEILMSGWKLLHKNKNDHSRYFTNLKDTLYNIYKYDTTKQNIPLTIPHPSNPKTNIELLKESLEKFTQYEVIDLYMNILFVKWVTYRNLTMKNLHDIIKLYIQSSIVKNYVILNINYNDSENLETADVFDYFFDTYMNANSYKEKLFFLYIFSNLIYPALFYFSRPDYISDSFSGNFSLLSWRNKYDINNVPMGSIFISLLHELYNKMEDVNDKKQIMSMFTFFVNQIGLRIPKMLDNISKITQSIDKYKTKKYNGGGLSPNKNSTITSTDQFIDGQITQFRFYSNIYDELRGIFEKIYNMKSIEDVDLKNIAEREEDISNHIYYEMKEDYEAIMLMVGDLHNFITIFYQNFYLHQTLNDTDCSDNISMFDEKIRGMSDNIPTKINYHRKLKGLKDSKTIEMLTYNSYYTTQSYLLNTGIYEYSVFRNSQFSEDIKKDLIEKKTRLINHIELQKKKYKPIDVITYMTTSNKYYENICEYYKNFDFLLHIIDDIMTPFENVYQTNHNLKMDDLEIYINNYMSIKREILDSFVLISGVEPTKFMNDNYKNNVHNVYDIEGCIHEFLNIIEKSLGKSAIEELKSLDSWNLIINIAYITDFLIIKQDIEKNEEMFINAFKEMYTEIFEAYKVTCINHVNTSYSKNVGSIETTTENYFESKFFLQIDQKLTDIQNFFSGDKENELERIRSNVVFIINFIQDYISKIYNVENQNIYILDAKEWDVSLYLLRYFEHLADDIDFSLLKTKKFNQSSYYHKIKQDALNIMNSQVASIYKAAVTVFTKNNQKIMQYQNNPIKPKQKTKYNFTRSNSYKYCGLQSLNNHSKKFAKLLVDKCIRDFDLSYTESEKVTLYYTHFSVFLFDHLNKINDQFDQKNYIKYIDNCFELLVIFTSYEFDKMKHLKEFLSSKMAEVLLKNIVQQNQLEKDLISSEDILISKTTSNMQFRDHYNFTAEKNYHEQLRRNMTDNFDFLDADNSNIQEQAIFKKKMLEFIKLIKEYYILVTTGDSIVDINPIAVFIDNYKFINKGLMVVIKDILSMISQTIHPNKQTIHFSHGNKYDDDFNKLKYISYAFGNAKHFTNNHQSPNYLTTNSMQMYHSIISNTTKNMKYFELAKTSKKPISSTNQKNNSNINQNAPPIMVSQTHPIQPTTPLKTNVLQDNNPITTVHQPTSTIQPNNTVQSHTQTTNTTPISHTSATLVPQPNDPNISATVHQPTSTIQPNTTIQSHTQTTNTTPISHTSAPLIPQPNDPNISATVHQPTSTIQPNATTQTHTQTTNTIPTNHISAPSTSQQNGPNIPATISPTNTNQHTIINSTSVPLPTHDPQNNIFIPTTTLSTNTKQPNPTNTSTTLPGNNISTNNPTLTTNLPEVTNKPNPTPTIVSSPPAESHKIQSSKTENTSLGTTQKQPATVEQQIPVSVEPLLSGGEVSAKGGAAFQVSSPSATPTISTTEPQSTNIIAPNLASIQKVSSPVDKNNILPNNEQKTTPLAQQVKLEQEIIAEEKKPESAIDIHDNEFKIIPSITLQDILTKSFISKSIKDFEGISNVKNVSDVYDSSGKFKIIIYDHKWPKMFGFERTKFEQLTQRKKDITENFAYIFFTICLLNKDELGNTPNRQYEHFFNSLVMSSSWNMIYNKLVTEGYLYLQNTNFLKDIRSELVNVYREYTKEPTTNFELNPNELQKFSNILVLLYYAHISDIVLNIDFKSNDIPNKFMSVLKYMINSDDFKKDVMSISQDDTETINQILKEVLGIEYHVDTGRKA